MKIETPKIIKTGIHILCGVVIGVVLTFTVSHGRQVKTITSVEAASGEAEEQKVTIEYISKKLENISELATAEMTYNNVYKVQEGKIPFITKKGFSMTYTATIKAGIDTSLLDIDVTDDEVKVIIPESEVQTPHVDPDSIQFYDEKTALFNKDEKTDITQAISAAEDDAEKKADKDGLLGRASEEAEYIIKGILEGSIGDRKLVVLRGKDL